MVNIKVCSPVKKKSVKFRMVKVYLLGLVKVVATTMEISVRFFPFFSPPVGNYKLSRMERKERFPHHMIPWIYC